MTKKQLTPQEIVAQAQTLGIATVDEVWGKMAAGDINADAAKRFIDAFQAVAVARAAEQSGAGGTITVKANPEKGSVSVYGVQRRPVTYYPAQWVRFGADPEKAQQLAKLLGEDCVIVKVAQFLSEFGKYLPMAKDDVVPSVPKELIGTGKPFRIPDSK